MAYVEMAYFARTLLLLFFTELFHSLILGSKPTTLVAGLAFVETEVTFEETELAAVKAGLKVVDTGLTVVGTELTVVDTGLTGSTRISAIAHRRGFLARGMSSNIDAYSPGKETRVMVVDDSLSLFRLEAGLNVYM
jgi:hypothetical protein